MVFDDETIQKLFGFEDAESESIERLKEYYFKKDTFDRVTAELPLRILVGHKGTGKSALFKVAISEEKEAGNLPILIKPDDIAELGKNNENFLLRIRQWKYGLIKIIGEKVFSEFGLYDEKATSKLTQFGLKLISFISETINVAKDNISLTEGQKILTDNFLKKKRIIVYIDDLDRGWEGKNKIEGSVVWCKWTNHEILVLLIKRILTYFGDSVDENTLMKTPQLHLRFHLERVMESTFSGRGKWENVYMYKILMSLIRKRPRDLVKLCSLAAQQAQQTNSPLIKTEHFQAIFEEYSQGRIQDTINEYKSELPNIENLLFGMRPTKKQRNASDGYIYTTAELIQKLNNIRQHTNFIFKNGRKASANELAQFLYKINFLTARKIVESGEIQRKYFEENRYISSSFVDFGYDWEVHPAFRWVLQPENINEIFNKLALSHD